MLAIAKNAIDLGIVTRNPEPMVAFYRDTLGFDYQAEMPMPGGGAMHRLLCGDTLVKIVTPGNLGEASAAPGGIAGASGFRYFTITVTNLDEAASACAEAGVNVPMQPVDIRPGVRICMLEDPDGNWVELLQTS